MELYLKIGNQNTFFIFAQKNKIIKYYIFPSYITLDRNNEILYIGPYSLLQYILLKQFYRITDYPIIIQNKVNKFNYYVKRVVENNIIQNYKDFFDILEVIFSFNLQSKFVTFLAEDYKKYQIPFFNDFENFYYFVKQIKIVRYINFLEEDSPYSKNQEKFLKDSFNYFKLRFESIPFWEFFYIFYPKMVNLYIGEENSLIWIINKYKFVKYKKINLNLRKIKIFLAQELLKKDIFLKLNHLENLAESFLYEEHNFSTYKYFEKNFRTEIIDFLKNIEPVILEDLYNEIDLKGKESLNVFRSVILRDIKIPEKLIEIFDKILIRN